MKIRNAKHQRIINCRPKPLSITRADAVEDGVNHLRWATDLRLLELFYKLLDLLCSSVTLTP